MQRCLLGVYAKHPIPFAPYSNSKTVLLVLLVFVFGQVLAPGRMAAVGNLRSADPNAPKITRKALHSCQINEWYPTFRRVTLKTKFIDLDPAFVEYLLSDGIIMPEGCEMERQGTDGGDNDSWSSSLSGGDDDNNESNEDQPSYQPSRPQFNELIAALSASIEELGGAVFPKLNWSAPRDTTWINAGENLKCVSTSDVILLVCLQSRLALIHLS
jgi:hypothetical protein